MHWVILAAVVGCAIWVGNASFLNAKETRDLLERQHEEQMAYLRYLKDLIATSRAEIRSAAGLPSFGEEFVAGLQSRLHGQPSAGPPDVSSDGTERGD